MPARMNSFRREELNEMEYNGTNKGLISNPEDLYVYRKRQHQGNTTPAGVEPNLEVTYFYKHSMPPASVFALHRNKLLAEAFYLRGDIEKFGTGYYRIQTELKNYSEIQFSFELIDGFMRCNLGVTPKDTPKDTAQVTAQDTAQDTAQVRELIMNIEGEMNREEIQKKLKLTHRENFRKFYLKPAIDAGLIEMTIPGKPKSRHQKYRLTDKGKRIKTKE
jgi:hypothetical protein